MILIFLIIMVIRAIDFPIAQPVVEEIDCIPFKPVPLSNVTFIAGINSSNESIDEVRLIAQECMEDVCFIDSSNISMNYSYSCCMDFYETQLQLTREDATQIKYHLEILSNGTWYMYNTSFIPMAKNSNENIINPEKNQTPGFEFISALISMLIILFYLYKN